MKGLVLDSGNRMELGSRWILARARPGLLAMAVFLAGAAGARAQSRWIAFGNCDSPVDLCHVPPPPPGERYVQFDSSSHAVALVSDGTLVAWGDNSWGQCDVPALPAGTRYVEVSAGSSWTVARRSDGSVVAWGRDELGLCDVPALPPGLTYVEVDAGNDITLARRSDGSVVAWGYCIYGGCDVPDPPAGLAYVDLAVGGGAFGLLSDGTIVDWSSGLVPPPLPAGVSYVEIAISSIGFHRMARRSDGAVLVWGGSCEFGACDVPALPPGVRYLGIRSCATQVLARRSDGSVVRWGINSDGSHYDVPALPPGFVYGDIGIGNGEVVFARADPLPACGSVASYCWPPAANSVRAAGASFEVAGCPGLTANDLEFHVAGLPPNKFGLFYYGSQPKHVPYGNGWTCVGGSSRRVRPGLVSDANGNVGFAVDLTQFPFTGSAQAIEPGSAWNFQFWYRDTAGSPSTFNFSDGRHIVFAP